MTNRFKDMLAGTTLRHRLLVFIMLPLLFSLLVAGSVSFYTARKETSEIYDRQLVLLAQVLHSLAVQEDNDDDAHKIARYETILGQSGANTFFYRLWIDDKLVLTSPNAKSFNSEFRSPGFSDRIFGGEEWRVFVFQDEKNEIVVEVAGRENVRTDIIRAILLVMFIPLFLVVPVIAILIWFGVVEGLRPISLLSQLIKSRDPHNLSPISATEISSGGLPDEIKPLVMALNGLMQKTKDVLESEKKFTDHAAHELQTPLAAIKTQAQVVMRTGDGEGRQQLLADLVVGVDRASHLVAQLLNLSRAQSEQRKLAEINLSLLVHLVAEEFGRAFEKRDLKLELDIEPDLVVDGVEDLLVVLVRNLIDNAMKYSPQGNSVFVSLTKTGGNAQLQVCNAGDSIPEDQQKNIFSHFYRLPGTEEVGCGLGLALVSKICEIHNTETVLESPDNTGMTRFSVLFRIAG